MRDDFLAAFGVFLIVVASTFPVALPLFSSRTPAPHCSCRGHRPGDDVPGRARLGRYAGYGSWKTGFMMVAWHGGDDHRHRARRMSAARIRVGTLSTLDGRWKRRKP